MPADNTLKGFRDVGQDAQAQGDAQRDQVDRKKAVDDLRCLRENTGEIE